MQLVEVDGVGTIEFPDELSPDEMKSALQSKFGRQTSTGTTPQPQQPMAELPQSMAEAPRTPQPLTPQQTGRSVAGMYGGATYKQLEPSIDEFLSAGSIIPLPKDTELPSGEELRTVYEHFNKSPYFPAAKMASPGVSLGMEMFPGITSKAISSGGKLLHGFANWALSPKGLAQQAALLNPITGVPMMANFFWDMAKGGGEQLGAAYELLRKPNKTEQDWQEFSDMALGGIVSIAMAGLLGRGSKGMVKQLDAAVRNRNVNQLNKLIPKLREQSGAKGELKLDPDLPGKTVEEQFIGQRVNQHADSLGLKTEYVERGTLREKGAFAQFDAATGSVKVDLAEMTAFADRTARNPKQLQDIIEATVSEEGFHSKVDPIDSGTWWNKMTGIEKKATLEHYYGTADLAKISQMTGKEVTAENIGYEAIVLLQKDLARQKSVQAASSRGLDWLETKTLEGLIKIVHKTRKALGTKASKVQQQILDQVMSNAESVKGFKTGEEPFAAGDRFKPDQRRDAMLGESLPPMKSESLKGARDKEALKPESKDKPLGSREPESIKGMTDEEFSGLVRGKDATGKQKYSLTVDATAWAMKQKATPELIVRLEAMAKDDVKQAMAKGSFPQKFQWYQDAVHVLKGDEVGVSNIETVSELSRKGIIQLEQPTEKGTDYAETIRSDQGQVPAPGPQPEVGAGEGAACLRKASAIFRKSELFRYNGESINS